MTQCSLGFLRTWIYNHCSPQGKPTPRMPEVSNNGHILEPSSSLCGLPLQSLRCSPFNQSSSRGISLKRCRDLPFKNLSAVRWYLQKMKTSLHSKSGFLWLRFHLFLQAQSLVHYTKPPVLTICHVDKHNPTVSFSNRFHFIQLHRHTISPTVADLPAVIPLITAVYLFLRHPTWSFQGVQNLPSTILTKRRANALHQALNQHAMGLKWLQGYAEEVTHLIMYTTQVLGWCQHTKGSFSDVTVTSRSTTSFLSPPLDLCFKDTLKRWWDPGMGRSIKCTKLPCLRT